MYIQGKEVNIDKNSKFSGILTCPNPVFPTFPSLKTNNFTTIVAVKSLILESTEWVWNSSKSLKPLE